MPTRQQCKRALEIHEDELSKLADVVGLGVVKLDESKTGRTNNAVALYIRRAQRKRSPAKKKSPFPQHVLIKGRGKTQIKVPIRIIEQGEVELESVATLGKEIIE